MERPSTSRCNHCSDLRALKIDSKATAAALLFLAAAAPLSLPGLPWRATAAALLGATAAALPGGYRGYPPSFHIPKGAVATAHIMGYRHSPSFCGLGTAVGLSNPPFVGLPRQLPFGSEGVVVGSGWVLMGSEG